MLPRNSREGMAAAKRSTMMAAVKRSTVLVLLVAAASAEPPKSLGDTLTDEAIGLAGQGLSLIHI